VTTSTILRLAGIPGNAAATTTVTRRNDLPNSPGNAVAPNGLGRMATPAKAPPPHAGGFTMRQIDAVGVTFPVTLEEGVTWFG
jgi:hypothetical protein